MFGLLPPSSGNQLRTSSFSSHPRVGRYQKLVEFMGGEIGVESVVAVESISGLSYRRPSRP